MRNAALIATLMVPALAGCRRPAEAAEKPKPLPHSRAEAKARKYPPLAENVARRHVIIWTVRTFDSLDEARDLIASREPVDDEVISKISSARRGTVDHWRELLKDAVLQEPEFNSATLEKWIEMGRLENEWRIAQARRLLTVQAENNRRDASHDQ